MDRVAGLHVAPLTVLTVSDRNFTLLWLNWTRTKGHGVSRKNPFVVMRGKVRVLNIISTSGKAANA